MENAQIDLVKNLLYHSLNEDQKVMLGNIAKNRGTAFNNGTISHPDNCDSVKIEIKITAGMIGT